MVVDTSALVCILLDEPERDLFEDFILRTPTVVTSSTVLVECELVLRGKRQNYSAELLDELIIELRIDVRPFDDQQARLARAAFVSFGKGQHPAKLNFGDCLVYGLAKARDAPLLFKGDDFARTDIVPAWRPDPEPA